MNLGSRGPTLSPTRSQIIWSALCMLGVTIYGALLPFNFRPIPFNESLASFHQISFFPAQLLEARGDWAISVAQFAILTFLSIAALAVDRPAWCGFIFCVAAVFACTALSIAIEFSQMFFPPRTVSINDIIVESIGGFTGVVLWLFAGQRIINWLRRFGSVSNLATLAKRLLPGYAILVLVLQLMPFDLVISAEELRAKIQEGKVHVVPFQGSREWTKLPLSLACFFPLGLLRTLIGRPSWRTAWIIFAFPAIVELLQLFVYSRSFDATDIVFGMVSVLMGVVAARAIQRRLANAASNRNATRTSAAFRSTLWLFALLGWIALVLYLNWWPFNFSADASQFTGDNEDLWQYGIRRMAIAPFVDYYCGSKYNALDQFVRKGLSFAPLGILLAVASRSLRSSGGGTMVWIFALMTGAGIEIGRYYLPGRNPSVTDMLVCSMGAVFGYWFTQYVLRLVWAEVALYGWMHSPQPFAPQRHTKPTRPFGRLW